MFRKHLQNQDGIGLIAAIFIIVVVAMFGVLIARYTMISSQASAEDFLWSQALYAAESGAKLRILHDDGGGPSTWGAWSNPITINTFTTSVSSPLTISHASASIIIREITSKADRTLSSGDISRTIEVRYTTP